MNCRRPVLLASLCLLVGLPACGTASRAVLARQDFVQVYKDPEALTSLRGAEPTQSFLWMESARVAAVDSAEDALALVEQGLLYHPTDPALLTARIELLGGLGHYEECLASAQQALSRLPSQQTRPGFRMGIIRALLALHRLDQVEPQVMALGGERGVAPAMVADAWARLALAYAAVGRASAADRCLDLSLLLAPDGLGALAQETMVHPEHLAAARSLRRSAALRHPADADVGLTVVIDLMEQGHLVEATRSLHDLPRPLPERLIADVHALDARLMILQGQVDEGLSKLYERLDAHPLDPPALGVLQETWARLGQPGDEEMLRRLLIARRYVDPRDGTTLARLDAILDELEQRIRRSAAATVGP